MSFTANGKGCQYAVCLWFKFPSGRRPPALPELTDEVAAQIQRLMGEWLLWFSAAYGEQIRRCNEPWAAPPREPPPRHRIDDPF